MPPVAMTRQTPTLRSDVVSAMVLRLSLPGPPSSHPAARLAVSSASIPTKPPRASAGRARCQVQRRPGAAEGRLGLVQGGLVGGIIDLEKDVAFLHVGA